MPHISVKMLKGRTEAQKEKIANVLTDALCGALGMSDSHITLSIEDYTAEEWQGVFETEVTEKENAGTLYVKAKYDPKSLL